MEVDHIDTIRCCVHGGMAGSVWEGSRGEQQYATVTLLTVPCSLRAEWEEEEEKRGGEKMEPFWR